MFGYLRVIPVLPTQMAWVSAILLNGGAPNAAAWRSGSKRRGRYVLHGRRYAKSRLLLSFAAISAFLAVPLASAVPAEASGPATGAAYVALGDSYSSGEGLGPFQSGTAVGSGAKADTCHRSAHAAYPDLSPAVVLPSVASRVFWACSGATTGDMTHTPGTGGTPAQYGQPEQELTVGAATKYISLTVGGDDLGFTAIVKACATLEFAGKTYRISKTSCSAQLKSSEAGIPALRSRLAALYTALLARSAPGAELAVAGYPRVFPTSYKGLGKLKGQPFCTFDHLSHAGWLATLGFYVSDAQAVAAFEQELNAAIQASVNAVAKAHPGQIKYSDIYPASVPRDCTGTTPNATVTGLELSPNQTGTGPGHAISTASFHPTTAGQKVYAKAIEATFSAFAAERKTITFVDAPGAGAPPAKLGPFTMSPFADDPRPDGSTAATIAGPTGTLALSNTAEVVTIGDNWNTWSNGYTGSAYWFGYADTGAATSATITLPPHTGAVYFYAEPDEYETFDLSASANNGTTSGDQTVLGNSGASYFGFYASKGASITTIKVSCPDDFALGEFAIAAQ